MTNRQLISPPTLHPAPGFSHIAVVQSTRIAYLAGQIALDAEGNIIGGDDLYVQTVAAMKNVEIALATIGADWSQVVRRTIYTTRPTEKEAIAAAIAEVQGSEENPAQTIVGITGLVIPGLLIEIETTVALP